MVSCLKLENTFRKILLLKKIELNKVTKKPIKQQSNVPWMPKDGWWSAYVLCIFDMV